MAETYTHSVIPDLARGDCIVVKMFKHPGNHPNFNDYELCPQPDCTSADCRYIVAMVLANIGLLSDYKIYVLKTTVGIVIADPKVLFWGQILRTR